MKKSLLILLFTCWALFFAAFRPVMPFAAETAAFPDGTPVTGGRILMGTIGEPSNLIPYMASDSASGRDYRAPVCGSAQVRQGSERGPVARRVL